MFRFLHSCMKLFNLITGYQVDQNSTEEFDKDFQVDEETRENFEKFKDSVCTEFLNNIVESQKIKNIYLYTLANYEINPEETKIPGFMLESYKTLNFIKRIAKFVKSCGVHTKLPYLFTRYGSGDIPQGFSRLASVFGSIYCINPKIRLGLISKEEEAFTFSSNLVK